MIYYQILFVTIMQLFVKIERPLQQSLPDFYLALNIALICYDFFCVLDKILSLCYQGQPTKDTDSEER
jgi:hypothetical protein